MDIKIDEYNIVQQITSKLNGLKQSFLMLVDSRLEIWTRVLGEWFVCVPQFVEPLVDWEAHWLGAGISGRVFTHKSSSHCWLGRNLTTWQPQESQNWESECSGEKAEASYTSYSFASHNSLQALQVTLLHFHSILSITSTSQAHSNSRFPLRL